MLCTVKWVKKVSCGGVFDLAVEQPQLFRKLHKNKNKLFLKSVIEQKVMCDYTQYCTAYATCSEHVAALSACTVLVAYLLPWHSTNCARLCCVVLFLSYVSSKMTKKMKVYAMCILITNQWIYISYSFVFMLPLLLLFIFFYFFSINKFWTIKTIFVSLNI